MAGQSLTSCTKCEEEYLPYLILSHANVSCAAFKQHAQVLWLISMRRSSVILHKALSHQ